MEKKFQRKKEDFICENCGKIVSGNGYTNHCPDCLYSKHVDINPGDRLATCGGLMKPIGYTVKGSGYNIIHRCLKCGFERKNKFSDNDNFETLLKL
jgi:ribosomal protein L37E